MRYLKRAGWLALLALLIAFVAKNPGHADTVAHHLAHNAAKVSDAFSTFLGGL